MSESSSGTLDHCTCTNCGGRCKVIEGAWGVNIQSSLARSLCGLSEGARLGRAERAKVTLFRSYSRAPKLFSFTWTESNHLTMDMALQADPFVFNCPSRRGSPWPSLKMTAKRYRALGLPLAKDGLTLLLFHCVGARESSLHNFYSAKICSSYKLTR